MKKFFATLLGLFFTVSLAWAQFHLSSQPHSKSINNLIQYKNDYISIGKDGYLIKWGQDGIGEHFQISDLELQLLAIHPNGTDIALYETDGFAVHRISVWNLKTQKRRYAKRFTNPIISLNFSSKGTYIMAGTTSVEGMILLRTDTGKIVNPFKEKTGIITYSYTSNTENSCLLYSTLGSITYYNMKTGQQKASFETEPNLENIFLYNNNISLIGSKNNTIYIINALNGKTTKTFSVSSPIILKSLSDTEMLYISQIKRNEYSLNKIFKNELKEIVSEEIAHFSLAERQTILSALMLQNQIFLGTNQGHIFKLDLNTPQETSIALKITERMYDEVYDIASLNNDFYILTKEGIYKTSTSNTSITPFITNIEAQNLAVTKDYIVTWTKDTVQPINVYSFSDLQLVTQFIPKHNVNIVDIFNDKIATIENNTTISLYSIAEKTQKTLYSGNGLQDVLFYNDSDLYVAKSTSSNPKSSLLKITIATGETVPISITGELAFSLEINRNKENAPFYGINVSMINTTKKTEVFSFLPSTQQYTPLLQWADEDTQAQLLIKNNTLFTNIGRNQYLAVNLSSSQNSALARSASLPLKLTTNNDRILVLNRNGSLTWYNATTKQKISDWYLTINKEWMEF
ncbi:MAG: hypothetical protein E7062_01840 [Spirochaetaceae bacterium]|nr:hypothetical protein [Spirochaetaceae bacterium]